MICDNIYHEPVFLSLTEKTPVVDEVDAGQEMTEEEWTRRVAELNKHQVIQTTLAGFITLLSPHHKTTNSFTLY